MMSEALPQHGRPNLSILSSHTTGSIVKKRKIRTIGLWRWCKAVADAVVARAFLAPSPELAYGTQVIFQ
jgi:hypothetical protein